MLFSSLFKCPGSPLLISSRPNIHRTGMICSKMHRYLASLLNKKFAGCVVLSTALLTLPPVQAACIEVTKNDQLPVYIKAQQCYELQGGNIIHDDVNVQGKLFIKAGRSAILSPGSSINIVNGGLTEIRGQLDVKPRAKINLDDGGSLSCSGLIYMEQQSSILSRGETKVRNIGRVLMEQGSSLVFTGKTEIRSSGQITLDNASLQLRQNSVFTNAGTISFDKASFLTVNDQSRYLNLGKTELNASATLELTGFSRLLNRRNFLPKGNIKLKEQAIIETEAPFRLQPSGRLMLTDSTQLLNNHTLEIYGKVMFTNRARILNDGTFAVKKEGNVRTTQLAVVINTGTFRNEGGGFIVDNQSNFINENIVSGRDSRLQDRDRYGTRRQERSRRADLAAPAPAPAPDQNQAPDPEKQPQPEPQQSQSQLPQQLLPGTEPAAGADAQAAGAVPTPWNN